MFALKDFWAAAYYAALLDQLNSGPYLVHDQGTAREALDALAGDWRATILQSGCK